MKFQKLVMATSVCAALSGVSVTASANLVGLPSEAVLVTPVFSDPAIAGPETYVALRVPITIGSDYIINTYTAPNTTESGAVTVQTLDDPRIYWAVFNENSVKIEDGTCDVSPGDVVIWSTDPAVRLLEQAQRTGLINGGIIDRPNPVCGPTNPPRTGYAIFQTISGADGLVADFAFTADAVVQLNPLVANLYVGVPAVPMADAADPLPSGSGFPTAVPDVYMNEVIASGTYGDTQPRSPVRYAPITAGIRFDNGNGVPEDRLTQLPLVGPNPANSVAAHVYWFNLNQPTRTAFIDLWDDMEGQCSIALPLPRELNIWAYNLSGTQPAATLPSWGNVAGYVIPAAPATNITDLIDVVDGGAYTSGVYCSPAYWQALPLPSTYAGALAGYAENAIAEYGYAAAPDDGLVHTAGLQYAMIRNLVNGLWSGHMATDIGVQ